MSKTDYDLTKIRGFVFDVDGVLSPSTIPLGFNGLPARMVNVKDGYAIQQAVKHHYEIAVITGSSSEALEGRYKSLGVKDIFMKVSAKLPVLTKWMQDNGLQKDEVVFAGDDIPDLECMRAVGLSVAPSDAAIEVLEEARYVSDRAGGYGVCRDIIEQVLKAQGKWMPTGKAFVW